MADLEFKGMLPIQEKPTEFKEFRIIASEQFDDLEGKIVFQWIESLNRFDIVENTTVKNELQLRNMLSENKKYLV